VSRVNSKRTAQPLTPITTTSFWSIVPESLFGLGDSLGSGGARDGRILRSLAALEVSSKTGILQADVCDVIRLSMTTNANFERTCRFSLAARTKRGRSSPLSASY
jgi:hypothetical protein